MFVFFFFFLSFTHLNSDAMDMQTLSFWLWSNESFFAIYSFNKNVSDLKNKTTEHTLLLYVGTEALILRSL